MRRKGCQRRWKEGAGRASPIAQPHRVRFAGVAQFMQERHWIGVEQIDVFRIGDGEGKSGALQQGGAIAEVGEGRNAWAGAAGEDGFDFGERGAQRVERAEDGEACEKQPVRTKRLSDLDQCAGKVVRPVQRKTGDNKVETARRERQKFGFAGHRHAASARCEKGGGVE